MSGVATAIVAGSVISGAGARSAGKRAARSSDRAADLAYQQSLPWDISGMFGGATFDEGGRTSTLTLTPELKEHYDRLFGRADVSAEQVEALAGDPFEVQQKLYEQQKGLFAPQQQQEQLAMENRLRAQGMLGGTGGQMRMGKVLEAQQQQDLARQVQSLDQAQGLIDLYRAREAGDISQALTLGELPLRYAELGRGIGSGMSSAAQYGAGLRSTAATSLAGSQAAFWDQLGSKISNYNWGGGGVPQSNTTIGGGYSAPATTYGSGGFSGVGGSLAANQPIGLFN